MMTTYSDMNQDNTDNKENSTPREELKLVFIPALLEILTLHEKRKGEPLTHDEVLAIRDRAGCIAMTVDEATAFEEHRWSERGVYDPEPENVWEEWLKLKQAT